MIIHRLSGRRKYKKKKKADLLELFHGFLPVKILRPFRVVMVSMVEPSPVLLLGWWVLDNWLRCNAVDWCSPEIGSPQHW